MAKALVVGVNGQDGSYLAEALLRRGYDVDGIGRSFECRYVFGGPFRYHACDLRDSQGFTRLIGELRPDLAFHVAAVHGAAGFVYEPFFADLMSVNVNTLQVLLEHGRMHNRSLRLVYAGSAKVFPTPHVGIIDEATPQRSTCLYGLSKIAARDLMTYYRHAHGIISTNLLLFNHESPRRPSSFILPKIAAARALAEREEASYFSLRSLDFWIDWSSAEELMDIAVDLAERSDVAEVVLASGTTWNARQIVARLFEARGLDLDRYLRETQPRSEIGPRFQVRLDHLDRAIGRVPRKDVFDIVDEMNAAEADAT